jgi:LacI family transcriptional regulator
MAKVTNGPRRRTLQDVAQAVGLSVNTVSRALNDMPGVSPATRARIKAEAERTGYVPNVYARSLVLGSPKTIGVIVTDLTNPFFSDLVSEIESRAAEAGYSVLLLISDEDAEREQDAVNAALRAGVDGLIAAPVQGRSNPWAAVTRAGIPLVFASRSVPELGVDFFSNDNAAGMRMSTNVVLDLGVEDVVLIEEDLPISTVQSRIAGFQQALEEHGIVDTPRRTALIPARRSPRAAMSWAAEDAYRVAVDLLDRGRRPDAFVVGSDYFALGLYSALRSRGIRIPEDVMVMGWGDYTFARYLDPPLSSLQIPSTEIARRAIRRLLERLESATELTAVTEYITPELALRGSTRR